MGCFPSKEHSHERKTDSESSSGDEDSIDLSVTEIRPKSGRVGIAPISSSSSSSSGSPEEDHLTKQEVTNPYRLVGKLAMGIQEISDDESSTDSKSIARQKLFSSPDATFASSCNQSMDDIGDESVVDWLAESRTSLFTTTTLGNELLFDEEEKQQTHKPAFQRANDADRVLPGPSRIVTGGSSLRAIFAPPKQATDLSQIITDRSDLSAILAPPKQSTGLNASVKHVVKDTTHVERRHAPLPSNKPSATTGSWLTNRYCVNDYIVLSEIGKGAHSEVRLCKHKKSNELFAVKIMNRKLLESKIVDIQKEVAIMKKLRHQHILRLYEDLDDPKVNKVYLITEFAHQGDLMNIIKKDTTGSYTNILSDEELRDITKQVMRGLLYLHQNNICHNDLKPSNILVNGDGLVKIADFGVSMTGRVRLDSAGTPAFMSPEVVAGDPHDGQLADCYALGATIFCLKFGGRLPFIGKGGQNNQKLLDLYNQIKDAPLVFPHPVDSKLRDLISRLMLKDPIRRMRLRDALRHPWLQEDENE
mmetsp:Transcript_23792/g.49791  ORF Transcript_23792/g.49791 Transcript_23792/m.49791 type:complete len:532 (-) Transcript_23792:41-1636(-)